MGNVESQNGENAFHGVSAGHLSRKHASSRSLRLSSAAKQSVARRPRHSLSAKQPERHRNSEASTRSSSTPSIPRSLAESGPEAFDAEDAGGLTDLGVNPHWTQRVAMTLRPEEHDASATPTPDTSEADTLAHDDEPAGFKKMRSKSADMWREDSLEFSLSDLSQEHMTSTEEMVDGGEEEEEAEEEEPFSRSPRGPKGVAERASSLDHLCSHQSAGFRDQRVRRRDVEQDGSGGRDVNPETGPMSPSEEDGGGGGGAYGAFTLPCRRSHCLSEGLSGVGLAAPQTRPVFQGRRAQTTQDISAALGEGSEYGDSGIDGVAAEPDVPADGEQLSRRCKAMSASFSVYSAVENALFRNGSDSGSSSAAEARGGGGGVYENFRKELDNQVWAHRGWDRSEEASSAVSDEQSSGTLSSAYPSESAVAASCAHGTVRKAGALAVKNFLVHKKGKKVEPAARRKWKHYWVSLKGCTLFLYESDGRSGIDHTSVPKHALWAENAIVQAVPEHPKKDFVFCLSNSAGDAFLFQTSGQTELENWITAIHSACAATLARQHHRDDTVRLLRAEIRKLEQKIDMDEKMKKMGNMQLSTVTDAKKRKTILEQIFLWEQNLERFHMDLFRCRCYLASLQGGEPPNPKRLLGFASRPTKLAMGRLGIFSVSSFHALVSARTEIGVKRRSHATPSRTFSKRRSRFSSLWGLDTASRRKSKAQHPTISQVFVDGVELAKAPTEPTCEDSASDKSKDQESSVKSLPQLALDTDVWLPESLAPSWVCLPGDQPVLAVVQPGDTSLEVLSAVCKKNKLDPSGHYLRLKVAVADRTLLYVPKPDEDVYDVLYQEIEICTKTTRLIQFDRDESCTLGYGFSVSVMDEDGTQRLHITDVKAGGLASAKGVRAGDEILLLNGKPAAALQMDDMRVAFACHALTLSVGALPRLDPAALCPPPAPRRSDAEPGAATTDIFSQSQEDILDDVSGLTVDESLDEGTSQSPRDPPEEKIYVQKNTAQVSSFHHRSLHDAPECQMLSSSSSSSSSTSLSPSPVSALPPSCTQRQLSHADKLRKVISELVDTEKTYVKDLRCLIECYLTPLQKESFLTQDELDILFGNLGEMVDFQVEFLRTLEDGIRLVPNLDRLERVEQFKKVLFSLGGSFLYYADRFKIYSAFCASHTKVPKVLAKAKTDPDFKAFLSERNPKQQHSSTLESYLIKPIQRVLKYPLLLRELFSLTDPDSDEHYHLDMAMKAMNKVASHINEMQKLHEEFGAVFDQLISEQKEVGDLSMGDLLMHSSVVWVNPPASLGKGKKDPELAAFVFKTAVVFVYKDSAKHRKKVGGSHRSSMNDDRDPFRFRHMIGTHSLQVRALTNSEGTAVCEIVHTRSESEGRPERTFQLCCSSAESKKDLLKAVHSILREKQRRQLLKTESLPLSQQYVPFGGKRLCALKGAHRPVVNRAASAPSRSLARRKLLRNRFTIDTDLVLDTDPVFNNNNHHRDPDSATLGAPSPPSQHAPVPSELWLEQQFDLRPYEDAAKVKETDILSDDDEYCKSRREGATATQATELDAKMDAMEIRGVLKACAAQRGPERDTVWVRREDYGCNRDVF
ncbi:rho guanine nucleotide exchange factor TIAM1-like isoform X1 [Phyllopteryx taeniolatus]|uniref:rho guanine nucleotide exchange factor TIAM1-like isoform X1 n=1 Tax=Phyllopteryx taeniolatus TaxID=161469 RepID=UPI002AD486E3|nr:rho guanine nucleotide exchange factor TIAM1-like isoform X1 [Phyllopteryx taeniolatus]XP_061608215.1 rho guanine nucleotide exchange factor TIAM1-like isoform X1 [Phyllopteryx taeniolatus]XP_061608216.1 rho guanine nucleotide exchange factor TIAM1-like isoform X1 [Phyllopteryx taeniolatus]